MMTALVSLPSWAAGFSNLVGGEFTSQAMSAVARINDATSPAVNPAGLSSFNKDSISSGASAYSFQKDNNSNDNKIKTNSSTAHVSYIQSLSKYNIGFMVFTAQNYFDESNIYENFTNDEGYRSYYDNSSQQKVSVNSYIFAFSPKKSNWGFSLALTDYQAKYLSDINKHKYSKTDIYQRETVHQSSQTNINFKIATLSFGQQFSHNNLRFGYALTSPSFIIANDSNYQLNYISVLPSSATNAYVFTQNHHDSLKKKTNQFDKGNITLGAAFVNKKISFEFNLKIAPAYTSYALNTTNSTTSALWIVNTDTYAETETKPDKDSSHDYLKASVIPSFGLSYQSSGHESIGVGSSFSKTTAKDDSGTNTLTITTGYSKRYKNFKGSYSLVYIKNIDTGHNTQYNAKKEIDEKADIGSEQLSFVFGGSYIF